jgi:hypothetical protein
MQSQGARPGTTRFTIPKWIVFALLAATPACAARSEPVLVDPAAGRGPVLPLDANSPKSLVGLHDGGGEVLHERAGYAGWTLEYQPLNEGNGPRNYRRDFTNLTNRGIRVLVRVDNSWESGKGTIPCSSEYDAFAKQAADYIISTVGVTAFVIGNEPNMEPPVTNWPTCNGAPERITPERYARLFKAIRDAVKTERPSAMLALTPIICAMATNASGEKEHGLDFMKRVYSELGPNGFDAVTIHSFSSRHDASLVKSEATRSDSRQCTYEFRSYRDQIKALPSWAKSLPVYITEAGAWDGTPESMFRNQNNGWARAAARDVLEWNASGKQKVDALIYFRWTDSDRNGSGIELLPLLQDDIVSALRLGDRLSTSAPRVPAGSLSGGSVEIRRDGRD